MVNLELTTALKTRYALAFMDIPFKEEVLAIQKLQADVKPKKRKAGEDQPHVARPTNMFMLFRQYKYYLLCDAMVPELIASYGKENVNQMFSKVASYYWKPLSEDSDVKTFWKAMQVEAKERHAEAHPGYKFCPRAKAVNEPASKKCKTKRTKSSASRSASVTPASTDTPQTPVWDPALKDFEFTFEQGLPPSVASPQQSSPQSYTPSPPVNAQDDLQLQGYLAPQPFVSAPSQPQFDSTTASAGEGFYGPENAIAGPSNLYTPERSYSPDEFNGDAFVQDYDSVPVVLAEQVLSLCQYTFPAEVKYGVNFDDLEPDDELITSMSPVEQDVFALRLDARAAFRQWQTYDL